MPGWRQCTNSALHFKVTITDIQYWLAENFYAEKLLLMKIRLQEIELGTQDPGISKDFYNSILGLVTTIDNENLKVFKTGVEGIDFNVASHLPAKVMVTSFLTDNLQTVIERLDAGGISFDGPKRSHLGMTTIEFKDPDGYLIRVNQPGDTSPGWLTV